MKISREAWDLKEECFGPLLPYVKDQQVTDINYNGTDVWIEHLKYGIRKAPVNLTPEFAGRFSVLISNIVSEQINKFNNVLEAETDTLRISIIHPSVTNTGYSISIRKNTSGYAYDRRKNAGRWILFQRGASVSEKLYGSKIEYGLLRVSGSRKNRIAEIFNTIYTEARKGDDH